MIQMRSKKYFEYQDDFEYQKNLKYQKNSEHLIEELDDLDTDRDTDSTRIEQFEDHINVDFRVEFMISIVDFRIEFMIRIQNRIHNFECLNINHADYECLSQIECELSIECAFSSQIEFEMKTL